MLSTCHTKKIFKSPIFRSALKCRALRHSRIEKAILSYLWFGLCAVRTHLNVKSSKLVDFIYIYPLPFNPPITLTARNTPRTCFSASKNSPHQPDDRRSPRRHACGDKLSNNGGRQTDIVPLGTQREARRKQRRRRHRCPPNRRILVVPDHRPSDVGPQR